MGKFIKRLCTECGGHLTQQKRNKGYGCSTNGCPVQKVFLDKEGKIVEVLYSSEPKSAPIGVEQLRIMAEVKRI